MADHGTAGSAHRQRQGSRRCGPPRHSSPASTTTRQPPMRTAAPFKVRYRDGYLPGRNAPTRRTAIARRRPVRRTRFRRRLTATAPPGARQGPNDSPQHSVRTSFSGAVRAATADTANRMPALPRYQTAPPASGRRPPETVRSETQSEPAMPRTPPPRTGNRFRFHHRRTGAGLAHHWKRRHVHHRPPPGADRGRTSIPRVSGDERGRTDPRVFPARAGMNAGYSGPTGRFLGAGAHRPGAPVSPPAERASREDSAPCGSAARRFLGAGAGTGAGIEGEDRYRAAATMHTSTAPPPDRATLHTWMPPFPS